MTQRKRNIYQVIVIILGSLAANIIFNIPWNHAFAILWIVHFINVNINEL